MRRKLKLCGKNTITAYWSLIGVLSAMIVSLNPVMAADNIWDRFSTMMQDIYGELVAISTIVAVTMAAVALLVRMIPYWERFVQAMNYAMMKQFSALEKCGRIAVLMGDIKKKGKLYSMIAEIVKPGTMENILNKAQHNCFSDNTQYSGAFIPILHEYVLIVRKDSPTAIPVLMCSQKTMDIRDMLGATWRDVIAAVLENCNVAVSLTYLYEQIEPHKKARANKWWKEKIRQTLQCNPAHFIHDDRGMWSLNKSHT